MAIGRWGNVHAVVARCLSLGSFGQERVALLDQEMVCLHSLCSTGAALLPTRFCVAQHLHSTLAVVGTY